MKLIGKIFIWLFRFCLFAFITFLFTRYLPDFISSGMTEYGFKLLKQGLIIGISSGAFVLGITQISKWLVHIHNQYKATGIMSRKDIYTIGLLLALGIAFSVMISDC